LSGLEPPPEPGPAGRMEVLLAHHQAMLDYYGETAGVRVARKHIGWYVRGFSGAAEFREEINRLTEPEAVRTRIRSFFAPFVERMAA